MAVGDELYEAIQSLIGGMSQAVDPQLLQPYQYAFGLNITDRKGLPQSRHAFTKLNAVIPDGKFQGAMTYRLHDDNRIVFAVSGVVYQLKLSDLSIITHTSLLSSTVNKMYFCQADRYMVIQDGDPSTSWANASWPVIIHGDSEYDQSVLRASNPEQALPKGADMAYGHGRLFVATNYIYEGGWSDNLGRTGFVAGDVIKAYRPEDVLKFTENIYLNEGGRVILPEELGYINGMGLQKNIMTGVGQGPLIVGAEKGFAAFQVNAPRAQWKDFDFGIVTYSGIDVGCLSPHSFQNDNADLMYRSKDGIRTLKSTATKADAGGGVQNSPVSNEVSDILALDDEATLALSEIAIMDSRVFITAVPNDDKDAFKALISFDKSPVSSITEQGTPIYDGVWTGFDFLSITDARHDDDQKLFAFVKKSSTETEIFYLDNSAYNDNSDTSVLCRYVSGYRVFESPFNAKRFKHLELWLSDIIGDVNVTAYYRLDNYPYWNKCRSSVIKSDPAGAPQRRCQLRLTALPVDDDPALNGRLDAGYVIQYCIEWTGHCQIDKVKLTAEDLGANRYYIVSEEAEAVSVGPSATAVELDNYEYEVPL